MRIKKTRFYQFGTPWLAFRWRRFDMPFTHFLNLAILFILIVTAQSPAWARAGALGLAPAIPKSVSNPVSKLTVGAPPAPTQVAATGTATGVSCPAGLLCGPSGLPLAQPCPVGSIPTMSPTTPCLPSSAPADPSALTSPSALMLGAGALSAGAAMMTPQQQLQQQQNFTGSESASGGSYYSGGGGGTTGGGGPGFNQSYGTPAVADSSSPGSCNDPVAPEALAAYNQPNCKAKTQTGSANNALIVDADTERAWVISKDGSGTSAKCFVVTIGKASRATTATHAASFGQGTDQTPSGLLITAQKAHSNVFPQGHYTAMQGLDDSQNGQTFNRGVYLHEWHPNGTQGCIGIKGYQQVRDLLGYNGAPVYVYGKNMRGDGCGGSSAASSTATHGQIVPRSQ